MTDKLIAPPPFALSSEHRYSLRPRKKTSFHTVLSAADGILDPESGQTASVRLEGQDSLELTFEFPLARGCIRETLSLELREERLASRRLVRSVHNAADLRVRHEEIDFTDDTLPLPPASYPEVALPFLLSWQPFDGEIRDLFAWINDRFVARVEYQSKGTTDVDLPSGSREAVKMIMYPDLNDWVRLGKVLTKLTRPFVPKYHMWFDPEPPHTVLRFEGPYGPPGAPEIVMELLDE